MGQSELRALAQKKGWSEACAQGYVDGEGYRNRGERPPGHALFGIGEYSLGFRAGFFGVPLTDSLEEYAYSQSGFTGKPAASLQWTGPERRQRRVGNPSASLDSRQNRRRGSR